MRFLFYQLIIRPIIAIILGLNVRHRERLPTKGPAIIVSNHNSHLDTLVIMTLFPWRLQKKTFPVAAADYFLKNKLLAWFSQKVVGIIPIERKGSKFAKNPFANIQNKLDDDNLIIFFPEGSRGQPEKMSDIKKGITHLAKKNETIPIYPIFMYGLGKALPKDESLLVPFVIDVIVGEPLYWQNDASLLMSQLTDNFDEMKKELTIQEWE